MYACVPVLATPLVELKNIIEHYQIGTFIENHDPRHIAATIDNLLKDEIRLAFYKENTKKAAAELNWENEKKTLIDIFTSYA